MKFMTVAEAKAKGFQQISASSFLHASYPGFVFTIAETAADCAASGACFQLFPNGAVKFTFGADVGYHLYRVNGVFVREQKIPVHDEIRLSSGGQFGEYVNNTRSVALSVAKLHAVGTRWIPAFTGESLALSVHSRVSRGLLVKAPAIANTADFYRCKPMKLDGTAQKIYFGNGPVNATNTDLSQYEYGVTGGDRVGLAYGAAWSGELHLSVGIDAKRYVAAAKDGWLETLDDVIGDRLREVWAEAEKGVPAGGTPFSVAVRAIDDAGKLAFTGDLLDAVPGIIAGMVFSKNVGTAKNPVQDAYIPANSREIGSILIHEMGLFRWGNEPTIAHPHFIGNPNDDWACRVIPGPAALKKFTAHRVPDLTVVDNAARDMIKSATLFSAISPLTRPTKVKSSVSFADMLDFHEASRAATFRGGVPSLAAGDGADPEDPLFLVKFGKVAESSRQSIIDEVEACRSYEPFSRTLAEFGGRLFALAKS